MLGILFIACAGGELTAFPSQIQWGDVDFQSAMPDDGYDARDITLTNTGSSNIELSLENYNDVHICLQGLDGPQSLGTLEPEQSYSLLVGACGYLPEEGERDNEQSGMVSIKHSGDNSPVEILWSFTPILIIE